MGVASILMRLPVSARLAVCLAVSAGLHLAAVWGDWYAPSAPAEARHGLSVSLVTASAVESQGVTTVSSTSAESAQEKQELVEPPQSQPVLPRPKPLVEKPVPPEKSAAVKQQASRPEVQAQPEPGPESVFQSMDLVCAARQAEGTDPIQNMSTSTEVSAGVKLASLPGSLSEQVHDAVSGEPELVDAIPRYRSNPLPDYPYLARQRHWEGVVWLLVDVSHKGRVTALNVAESSGYGVLDKSALKSVRRWQFVPAQRLGVAVDSQVRVPVEFRLQN